VATVVVRGIARLVAEEVDSLAELCEFEECRLGRAEVQAELALHGRLPLRGSARR
jgi:hypothetical protein